MESFRRDYYDKVYYHERVTGIDPYLAYILTRHILPQDRSARILDVGCGTGSYVDFSRALGYDARGIDFSFEAAKRSAQMVASALQMPFADESFDLILSVHMLEHLTSEEISLFFKECHRVIKKKGALFIMTPNGIAPGRFILKEKWFPDPSHINIQDPFSLRGRLKKNHFSRIQGIFFLPLNKIKKKDSDIVRYYGLDLIFRRFPVLQDIVFFLLFSTPLSYFRDVIYLKAEPVK